MRSVCSALLLLLLLLVVCVCEGRIFSKCQLKSDLESARLPLTAAMGEKMSEQDLIARLVCKVNASSFNSSFVSEGLSEAQGPVKSLFQAMTSFQYPIMHQYGLFQLSDHVACFSGSVPTLNFCNISCSDLIDDDITDDIICLRTLIDSVRPRPRGQASALTPPLSTLHELLVDECRSVDPDQYFAECL